MARKNTTKIETHYFEQFLHHFSLPLGDVSYGGDNDDKPDLIVKQIKSDRIILGIEQTRFYVNSGKSDFGEQVQAKRRAEVLKKAEAEDLARIFSIQNFYLFAWFPPAHGDIELSPAIHEFDNL